LVLKRTLTRSDEVNKALIAEHAENLQAIAFATRRSQKDETQISDLVEKLEGSTREGAALKTEKSEHLELIAHHRQVCQQHETHITYLTAELDESKIEIVALNAYIAEAERTATGYWGNVEIPPIPYSLEPPRNAGD
jgi:chromosome segregation ATPase